MRYNWGWSSQYQIRTCSNQWRHCTIHIEIALSSMHLKAHPQLSIKNSVTPIQGMYQVLFYMHWLLTLIKGAGPLLTPWVPFIPGLQTTGPMALHSQPATEKTNVKSCSTHHLTPPHPFTIIPNVKTVGDTVSQWLHLNPPSLPIALKDWEEVWIKGKWWEVHGMKCCGWCKHENPLARDQEDHAYYEM